MPLMVMIQASSTARAASAMPARRSVDRTRSRISRAAASVKVMTRTWERSFRKGRPSAPEPGERAQATRWVSVKVLPEPAPASTKRGSSSVRAILAWRSFRPERSTEGAATGAAEAALTPLGWDWFEMGSLTCRASSRS